MTLRKIDAESVDIYASVKPPSRSFAHYSRVDDLGFLDRQRSDSLQSAEQILEFPAVLIKAPPWMGKTTFAKGLYHWLRDRGRFGALVHFTSFEESSDQYFEPLWWSEWK